MSRGGLALAAALVVVAAGVAAGISFAFRSGSPEITSTAYLARANAVCLRYARQLDRVPPPNDLTSFAAVAASADQALPVLEAQATAVRRIVPPQAMAARVRVLNALVARSNGYLRAALEAATRRDRPAMGLAFGAWLEASTDAHDAAVKLGFRCS